MNPLRWIRWKVLVAIIVIGGGFYLLGLDPLARFTINEVGRASDRTRWEVGSIDLGLLTGDVSLAELLVAAAKAAGGEGDAKGATDGEASDAKDKVASALQATFALDMSSALRRRFVVDEVTVSAPRVRVERRPDGTTNIGDLGAEEEEDEGAAEEPPTERDWVETAKKWYERIQKARKRLGGDEDGQVGEDGKPVTPEDRRKALAKEIYARRVTYPFSERPNVVIRRIAAEDIQVAFFEAGEGAEFAKLEEGTIEVTGVSDKPALHDEPLRLDLNAKLAGAPLKIGAMVDLKSEEPKVEVGFRGVDVPVSVVSAFVGESLPVTLAAGTIGVEADLRLEGEETIFLKPLLRFRGVRVEAKSGEDKVAGVDSATFVQAFNEASSVLGDAPLEIADLTITGTLSNPKFEWGDTVKNLVLEGGRRFAEAQMAKAQAKAEALVSEGAEKAREIVDEEAEKVRGKLEEEIGDALGESDAGKAAKDLIDQAVPKGSSVEDAAKDAARGALDSIRGGFRGFGSKEEKKPED